MTANATPIRSAMVPAAPASRPGRHRAYDTEATDTAQTDTAETNTAGGPLATWQQLLAYSAILSAVLGAVALLSPAGPVRLSLLVIFTILGPGCGLLCHIRLADPVRAAAFAVTASLTIIGALTTLEVWAHLWFPEFLHVVLVVATLVAGLVRILIDPPVPARLRAIRGRRQQASVKGIHTYLPWALLVCSIGFTAWAVTGSDWTTVGPYGLTAALGAPYVIGLLLPVVAVVLELRYRARGAVLTAACVVFALVTRAVAPLILPVPEYPWTYKHFGVTDVFVHTGQVVNSSDIYQEWPTFFTSVAHLSALSGIDVSRFGAWSSPLLALLNVLLLAAIYRALTSNRRIVMLAVFLNFALLWIDVDYFSPQAYAYTLALGFFAILLTWLRADTVRPHPLRDRPTRMSRAFAAIHRDAPPSPTFSSSRRKWAAVSILVVFAVITASHQLTPYLLAASVLALALFRMVRPAWLGLALLAIAVAYFLPRFGFVTNKFEIFNLLDFFQNAGGNSQKWATAPQQFSAITVRVLAVAMWLLALGFAITRRRHFGTVALPTILAFIPITALIFGNYGGEAIYRVFVFSLPWCAFLLGTALIQLLDLHKSRSRWTNAVIPAVVATLSLTGLAAQQGLQGQFALNRVSQEDLTALRHVENTAPHGATLVLAAPNAPTRSTAAYPNINTGRTSEPVLTYESRFRNIMYSDSSVDSVTNYVRSLGGTAQYLVISRQMSVYTDYFGQLPPGSLDKLRIALNHSRRWQAIINSPDIGVYKVIQL